MAMKQTQTKMFDFADVGLDFCSGSKNLFPDRFKKMLSQGYNEQTVLSVSVTGNQVTLNYGVAHGYAADRVLKINSGPLVAINGGEFWIDAVTTTSVTMTIDAAPISIAGGFVTKIAPLGWQLVFEQANIHVYQFKKLDETNLFIRLCFQNNASFRNVISPCIGLTCDVLTGFITDTETYLANADISTPNQAALGWEYQWQASNSYNASNYSGGYSLFGKGMIIGSMYHLISMHNVNSNNFTKRVCGVLPSMTHYFDTTPVLIGEVSNLAMSSYGEQLMLTKSAAFIKNTRVIFANTLRNIALIENTVDGVQQAYSSYVPTQIDNFQTTTCEPIPLYIANNGQHLGYISGGLYRAKYDATNTPAITPTASPNITTDIDLGNKVLLQLIASNFTLSNSVFFAAPIEEIKIA